MTKSRLLGLVLVASLVLTATVALAALPPGGTFSDDDGNTHEANIEAIAAERITRGCNPPTNDLYCPDDPVTRGQIAAFVVRALNLTDNGGGDLFVDDDDSIFESDIDKLATAGVTKGCNPPTNDLYCPDDPVTRGQMAAFLVRSMGYTDDGGGDLFVDDVGSIFESDIDKLATAGVTKGCNPPINDRYCPDDLVQRDQMASFLARALGLDRIQPPDSTTTTIPSRAVDWDCHGTSDGSWTCVGVSPSGLGEVPFGSWSCDETSAGFWSCAGNIDLSDVSSESWSCDETSAGFLSCAGNVDKSDVSSESFNCDGISAESWSCAGNVDKSDVSSELWSCREVYEGSWGCEGNIDKSDGPASEEWDCWGSSSTSGSSFWTCEGDIGKRTPFLSPVPVFAP